MSQAQQYSGLCCCQAGDMAVAATRSAWRGRVPVVGLTHDPRLCRSSRLVVEPRGVSGVIEIHGQMVHCNVERLLL